MLIINLQISNFLYFLVVRNHPRHIWSFGQSVNWRPYRRLPPLSIIFLRRKNRLQFKSFHFLEKSQNFAGHANFLLLLYYSLNFLWITSPIRNFLISICYFKFIHFFFIFSKFIKKCLDLQFTHIFKFRMRINNIFLIILFILNRMVCQFVFRLFLYLLTFWSHLLISRYH